MSWVDAALIVIASGLFAFLVALGVVRIWRMFGGGSGAKGLPRNGRLR